MLTFEMLLRDDHIMELDNVDVLIGMTIASIILGIGLSMFFIQPYTGYGAVVMAIGMMTLSLMVTARPRVIERVKREIVQPTPVHIPNNDTLQPEPTPTPQVETQSDQLSATTPTPVAEEQLQKEEKQTLEPTQPQPPENPPAQVEEPIAAPPN